MATYKKRGYKPQAEKIKDENDIEVASEDIESTTAEVFNTLDETANKAEEWVATNQKYIFGVVGALALCALLYIGYDRYVKEPKEAEAANEIFQAQDFFNQALVATETQKDSLYNLALNGGNGKLGLVDVADQYGSTATGNIANYYAGFSYLRTGKYKEAISYLDNFSSDDFVLEALAKGGIGDAFAQLDDEAEAFGYYEKAAAVVDNDFTTPKFLLKAAKTALSLGKTDAAVKSLEKIKAKYSKSDEFLEVEALLGQATAK